MSGLLDHYLDWTGYEAQQYDGYDDPHRTSLSHYCNQRSLPSELRLQWFTFALTALAELLFVGFAAIPSADLFRSDGG
jgi:hypothetical protein